MPRPTLVPGQTVSLVAPSGPSKPEDIDLCVSNLESLGFKVRVGQHVSKHHAFFAGTDAERIEDLNSAIRDSESDGIYTVRGGYGAGRILPHLDYSALKVRPKALIGYSDITALHLAIYAQAGIASYHGPIALAQMTPEVKTSQMRAMSGEVGYDLLAIEDAESKLDWMVPAEESVIGVLLGGNLCVVSSILGSPYCPSFQDAILFIEDIGEHPYRIDRFLNHLALNGVLSQIKAVVCGQFTNCTDDPPSPTVEETLHANLAHLGIPVVTNADSGHVKNNLTMPTGAQVELLPGPKPQLIVID